jgi:hypothetical protein
MPGTRLPKEIPMWVRGLLQAAIMGGIGLVLHRVVGHVVMAWVVWGLAGVVLVSALFIHRVYAAIEAFGRWLGIWAGTGVTYLLLVPFFYLVFVPGRLVLLLLGRDPMQRTFPSPESTCWSPRKTKMDEKHYRKQFS